MPSFQKKIKNKFIKMELTFTLFIIGIILGFILAYFLLHKLVEAKFRIALEKWKISSVDSIKKQVLDKSRAVLKGKIGEQIVVLLPEFKYNPADARFIGNPIDYLIFDGYSENKKVKITFMDIKKGKYAKLSKQQKRIKEAVDSKRIKWETLNLE
ncbi:hypothetical protein DRN69_06910 [Candidatus Pacearchaeota archaeon]|nr:MAG: hypothetical protein DRN69_06910 [Candidatus Pacearchaeota archaeon]